MSYQVTTFYVGTRPSRDTLALLAEALGGATVTDTFGSWLNPDTGEVEYDNGAKVECVYDPSDWGYDEVRAYLLATSALQAEQLAEGQEYTLVETHECLTVTPIATEGY